MTTQFARPFPRLSAAPLNDEPEPQQEQVAEPYAPPVLPAFGDLEGMAHFVSQQARALHNSGQLIVADHRRTLDSLMVEAETLEQECVQAIDEINRSYNAKLARNARMRHMIEGMIGHYTQEPVIEQQVKLPAPQPKPRGFKMLLGIA